MGDAVVDVVAAGTITRISRWAFNCYVVHDGGDGAPLVIDPGTPSNGADASRLVERLGATSPPAVVCTHGHVDHVAGVERVCQDTGAEYHLPAPCEAFLARAAVPRAPGPAQVVKIAPVLASQPFDLGALVELGRLGKSVGHTSDGMVMPRPPTSFLADLDGVPGAAGWQVLATPGHSDDAICLYHAATKTLFGGDSVLTHQGVPWINPEVVDPVEQQGTETRLRALDVEHLLPGHGLTLSGPDLMAGARSFRDRPPGRSRSERLSRRLGSW